MLANEASTRAPAGQRIEILTQNVGPAPPRANDRRILNMRHSIPERVEHSIDRERTEALACGRERVAGEGTEAAVCRHRRDLQHFISTQSIGKQMEVVHPHEIARSRMMTCPMNQRDQQRMDVARCRG